MDRLCREAVAAYSLEQIWCEAFVCREGVVQIGAVIDLPQQFTDRTGAKPMDVLDLPLALEIGCAFGRSLAGYALKCWKAQWVIDPAAAEL